MNESLHLWLIPLLPFAGFLLNGILGSRLPRRLVTAIGILAPLGSLPLVLNASAVTIITATTSCAGCGPVDALALPVAETSAHPWLAIGALHVDFSFVLDQLSLVMLLVVTGVGFLIHVYSVGYMHDDPGYARYFSYPQSLSLLHDRPGPRRQRSAHVCRLGGRRPRILSAHRLLVPEQLRRRRRQKSLHRQPHRRLRFPHRHLPCSPTSARSPSPRSRVSLGAESSGWHGRVLTVICLCLLLGAAGKSAQLPLYVWLPDAMEGPTPVSALIHAATMVTAGVYMIARTHFLFDRSPLRSPCRHRRRGHGPLRRHHRPVQNDIKRVLAYSTISQLGYMFLACGVAAYSAAIFHLVTHAFFKALLFLAAGSVIHAMGGEQDMRKMGGLRKKLPVTFWTMTAAVFAIAGFSALRRLLLERRHPLRRISSGNPRQDSLVRRPRHRPAHLALHVPPLVHDLLRRIAQRRRAIPHASSPLSMRGPLGHSRPALASAAAGSASSASPPTSLPSVGRASAHAHRQPRASNSSSASLAVLVALEGWLIADKYYRRKPERPAQLAAAMPARLQTSRQQILRRRNLRRDHRQAAARLLKVRSRLGRRYRILGGHRMAARRHRQLQPE